MSESDQCLMCKHYLGLRSCVAFPEEIPQEIFSGMHDHSQPFEGDKGIRFEPDELTL